MDYTAPNFWYDTRDGSMENENATGGHRRTSTMIGPSTPATEPETIEPEPTESENPFSKFKGMERRDEDEDGLIDLDL